MTRHKHRASQTHRGGVVFSTGGRFFRGMNRQRGGANTPRNELGRRKRVNSRKSNKCVENTENTGQIEINKQSTSTPPSPAGSAGAPSFGEDATAQGNLGPAEATHEGSLSRLKYDVSTLPPTFFYPLSLRFYILDSVFCFNHCKHNSSYCLFSERSYGRFTRLASS